MLSEQTKVVQRWKRLATGAENSAAGAILIALVLLPLAEIAGRLVFGRGITGSIPIVQHLTLWIAFLGAALAAREGKLLALATGEFLPQGGVRRGASFAAGVVGTIVAAALALASYELTQIEREAATVVTSGLPVWIAQLVMPIAFALIALRLAWNAGWSPWTRVAALSGIALGYLLHSRGEYFEEHALWPALAALGVATILGGPLFATIGGAALLCFLGDGVSGLAVPAESYRMAVSPTLPAIPLFTLAGLLLAEGSVAKRLLELFRALFGWLPGGTAIVCATLCAFLTVFTGGSGVTLLVAGGLLFQALKADGYRERFSLGLLTASGSLGLLFPPALPLILYSIVAQIPVEDLFLGGLLPGLLMVGLVVAWGVREGRRTGSERTPLRLRAVLTAAWAAKLELLLPVLVVVALFGGFATLVETAAIAALYTLVLQVVVHRDVSLTRDVPRVLRECAVLVGGVLIILAVALGLTSWLVDAEVPGVLVEWVQTHVESRLAFLLALNVFLLFVGCTMDIFSATVVVVPLIVPLGVAYEIHPVHLGILFIANLELGYLTPPVGLNLFLASYRFNRPLLEIYRATVPMLILLSIGVLLITYLPFLTTALL